MSILVKLLASKLLEMGEEEEDPARAQFLADASPEAPVPTEEPRVITPIPIVNQPYVGPIDEEAATETYAGSEYMAEEVKKTLEKEIGRSNLHWSKQDKHSFAKPLEKYNLGRRSEINDAPGKTIVNAGTKFAKSMAKTFAEKVSEGTPMFSPEETEWIVSVMPVAEHGLSANDVNFKGKRQKTSDGKRDGAARGLFQMEGAALDTVLTHMLKHKALFDITSGDMYPFGGPEVDEALDIIRANPSAFRNSRGGKGDERTLDARNAVLDEINVNPALATWFYINWLNLQGDHENKSFDVPEFSDLEGTYKFLNQINRAGSPQPYIRNIYRQQYDLVMSDKKREDIENKVRNANPGPSAIQRYLEKL